MCNATSADLIREIVTARVSADEKFTAFDISLSVQSLARDRGEQVERHRDLKGTIHQELESYVSQGVYEKTLRDVGAPSPAFVYHPQGSDASDFEPLSRRNQQPAGTPPVNPTVTTNYGAVGGATLATDDGDDGDQIDVGRKPDARGTVAVPNLLLKQIEFVPKEQAYVYSRSTAAGKNTLVVTKEVPAGYTELTNPSRNPQRSD